MKPSHTVTPRQMRDAQFWVNADPIEFHPQSRTEVGAGFVLAVVIGIALALALVHFWVSP